MNKLQVWYSLVLYKSWILFLKMHLSESNISWIFSFLLIRSALSKHTSCRLVNIFRWLNWKSIQRALKKDFRNSGILWSFAEIELVKRFQNIICQNSGIYFDPFFFFVFLQLYVIISWTTPPRPTGHAGPGKPPRILPIFENGNQKWIPLRKFHPDPGPFFLGIPISVWGGFSPKVLCSTHNPSFPVRRGASTKAAAAFTAWPNGSRGPRWRE